jgi:hypothetical protein
MMRRESASSLCFCNALPRNTHSVINGRDYIHQSQATSAWFEWAKYWLIMEVSTRNSKWKLQRDGFQSQASSTYLNVHIEYSVYVAQSLTELPMIASLLAFPLHFVWNLTRIAPYLLLVFSLLHVPLSRLREQLC